VTHLDRPPSLLRNDSAGGAWLEVACEVPAGRATAIGAEVELRAGDRVFIGDVSSGGSFLSAHDPRLHFGLGSVEAVDRLTVRWPDGTRTEMRDVAVRRRITVLEGADEQSPRR